MQAEAEQRAALPGDFTEAIECPEFDLLAGALGTFRRMMSDPPGVARRDPERAKELMGRFFPRIVVRPVRGGMVAILSLTAEQLLDMANVSVRIGSPLRSYTGGAARVAAAGGTVAEVLADLEGRYPGMRFRMIDEQDRIRRHVCVFVNDREAATLAEPVAAGDQVHLICALSGG